MTSTVAKYVISVNTLIKADFLESENLGREPFVLGGNAGQRDFKQGTQSGSHVFSERLICVFSEGSSLTIALLLNSLGATGRFPAATGSPPHSRYRSMSRWKYPENIVENIRPTCSAVARTCCRAGGVLGTTAVDSLGPRWDRCRLLRSRPDRACACCSPLRDSASQGMERFSGFSQTFSEDSILELAETFPGDEIFWTKTTGNV